MSELKNITIAVGTSEGKMLPLVQDYNDYVAEYNMESSNEEFFNSMLNKYDSNVYSFFSSKINFVNDNCISKIAQAFEKDDSVMAVVCDGFYKKSNVKYPYYLNTNTLVDISSDLPIFFHKTIAKQISFKENAFPTLVETFKSCITQNKLIIHIATPLIIVNE
tara:strand:- start:2103 stop:2591 length:489 start_codon:yes stop_codon:yes gene_type:complete